MHSTVIPCSDVKSFSNSPDDWVLLQDSIWSRKTPSQSNNIRPPEVSESLMVIGQHY